jgi:phosphoribosyl-AMP cyclohydrolase
MTDPEESIPADGPSADPTAGLRFDAVGLVCAVVQQFDTLEVLMVAWMDAEALRRTMETGAATYFSRSRREYWVKGATSGNTQRVIEVRRDCDADTLLVLVDQTGVACHTGSRSCFDDGLIGSPDFALTGDVD